MEKVRIFKNKGELIAATIGVGDTVLDVGFSGQGIQADNDHWPHGLIKERSSDVYGVDLKVDREAFPDTERYHESSAESFSFPEKTFDVIFAGDIIEHLPNPGLFLEACARHMHSRSRLIITTPNCFNLFNLVGKLLHDEPVVNADHTFYFNHKTLDRLLTKCRFAMSEIAYVYSLEYDYKESAKKKFLNGLYSALSVITPKFLETLVVIAVLDSPSRDQQSGGQ